MLVACACASQLESTGPTRQIAVGAEQAQYHFDDTNTSWDTFRVEGDQALFQINQGALEGAVAGNRGYIWSLSNTRHSDIDIQVSVQQTKGGTGNGFGVMCRADKDGNGYYFVISSNGQFSILKAMPSVSDPIQLVPWQNSSAIRQGNDINHLEVACIGNYLSFSANGQFLAEIRDDQYTAGDLGVVLGAVGESIWVSFDNIVVRNASLLNSG